MSEASTVVWKLPEPLIVRGEISADGYGKRAADTASELLPVAEEKALPKSTAGTGRAFNAAKPPAIRGYKWSAKGAGFDCRKYDGAREVWIGYLGKKKLAELRARSNDRDELRQLVREWIQSREAITRADEPTKAKAESRPST